MLCVCECFVMPMLYVCVLCASCGGCCGCELRPRTFGCVAMGSVF